MGFFGKGSLEIFRGEIWKRSGNKFEIVQGELWKSSWGNFRKVRGGSLKKPRRNYGKVQGKIWKSSLNFGNVRERTLGELRMGIWKSSEANFEKLGGWGYVEKAQVSSGE